MALTPNSGSNVILPEDISGSSFFYLQSFGCQFWEHGLVRDGKQAGEVCWFVFLSGGQRFLGEQKQSFFVRVSRSVALN